MKKTSYFSHDSNARNSEKLLSVRMKYGAAGYGVYFMLLERLREEPNYKSVTDYNVIAFDLRVDSSVVKAVVENFGLFAFTEDGQCFYSDSLKQRMSMMDSLSKTRSTAGKKGAAVKWERERKKKELEMQTQSLRGSFLANASKTHGKCQRFAYGKSSKGKEKKLKEIDIERLVNTKEENADFSSALSFYQKRYPTQSDQDARLIAGFVSEYGLTDVLAAMECTLDRKKSSMKYTGGILRNWRKRDEAGLPREQGGGVNARGMGDSGEDESGKIRPSKFAGRWRKGTSSNPESTGGADANHAGGAAQADAN